MASDRVVTANHVLAAVLELQRRGSGDIIRELETLEPDLMEYVLETTSGWYHSLLRMGMPAKRANRLYRQGESITLVCLMALRRAHFELWQQPNPVDPPSSQPPTSGNPGSGF